MWWSALGVALKHICSYEEALLAASSECCSPLLFPKLPPLRVHITLYTHGQHVAQVQHMLFIALRYIACVVEIEDSSLLSVSVFLACFESLVAHSPVTTQIAPTTGARGLGKQPAHDAVVMERMLATCGVRDVASFNNI